MKQFKFIKWVAAIGVSLSIVSCKPIGQIFDDHSAPTSSSISINSGASSTNSTSVTLTLNSVDAVSMYVTNTAGCASGGNYEAYATSKSWTLGTTNGTATVYVKFKDRAGNESSCSNDSITHDSTAPTVSSVSSSTSNGSYKQGQAISIQVNFSEAVTVAGAGTPQLTLETGATDRIVNYVSGSGTTALTFTYTVQAGDTSLDLNYQATTSLALNGGTIKDSVGNNATLTLPALASASSLAGGKAIIIDTTAPTITSFSSTTPNGNYAAAATINITATASESVQAGNNFVVTLNTGATVTLTAASAGTSLTGTYTVVAGQNSPDLTVSSFAVGTVFDNAGNQLTSTSVPSGVNNIAGSRDIVIDTTAPTITSFSSTTPNGNYAAAATINITATASESVQAGNNFVVTLDTGATVTLTAAAAGTSLTGTYTVGAGQNSSDLTVSSFTAGTVLDAVGNQLTSTTVPIGANNIAGSHVIVIDTTSPSVPTISINNGDPSTNLTLVDLTLSAVGASEMCITNIAGCACPNPGDWETYSTSKTGHLLSQSSGTATVYVKYRDAALNESTCENDTIVIAPRVTNVTSSALNGVYSTGQSISIQVTFESAVTVSGTPTLTLETGTTDRVVTYSSGSGTATLSFNYIVVAGDNSSDLSYVNASSLALPGGATIQVGGINVNGTLPTPGASGSLSANKSIVVDTVPVVTNVTSLKTDGPYGVGTSIDVQVVFSEAVTVTGTPQLTLETGTNDAVLNYSSGSGSNTLVFNYVVAAGENSADLDYKNTSALSLNGGTIKDAGGDSAVLTLAAPGAPTSLGHNKALVISTPPVVVNVTSSPLIGTYVATNVITIQIEFNKSVTVTGNPLLTLETGSTDQNATCAPGTGTTINCTYTVQVGDTSNDLDYVTVNSLGLNSGTINDTSDNTMAAVLTLPSPGAAGSLGHNSALVIDPVPAVINVTSSKADGTYDVGEVIAVQVVFSEVVTVTGTPQLVLTTGSGTTAVNYVSGTGSNTLVFQYTIAQDDYFSDLDYETTTSLGLNGGTIVSSSAQNAVLTLAAPGAATSLGANKALRSLFYAAKAWTDNNESFGERLATGDVNGDGHPDVVVGFPLADSGDGRVLVYSGAANPFGSVVLMDIEGAVGDAENLGDSVTTADIDDDGDAEVIIGVPNFDNGLTIDAGKVAIYAYDSGDTTPAALDEILGTETGGNFGASVAGIGDINGDDNEDFAVGSPYANLVIGGSERGQVKVYSGDDRSELADIAGTEDGARLGAQIVGVGDVNNDGKPDFMVSAPTASGGGTDRGRVRVYSGASFVVLYNYFGLSDNDQWGSSLAGNGDIDGDGRPDFIIASRFVDPSVGAVNRGQAIAYSGATGDAIYIVTGQANNEGLGASIDFVGDSNNDGRKDFVIGSPDALVGGTTKGQAVVYNGIDGNVLYTIEGSETGAEFGFRVLGLRDSIENDSRDDFVIAAPKAGAGDSGKIFVYR